MIVLARVMSGWRTFGSSGGIGWNVISLLLCGISASTSLAMSRIVSSCGLPKFTGSWKSPSMTMLMPRTRSLT